MKKYFLFPLITLIVFACGARMDKTLPEHLANRSFALNEVNGVPFAAEITPILAFAGDMRISGAICNNFTGKAELKDDILTAKYLASTKKMCFAEDLNELESNFMRMLDTGMKAVLDGEILTLSQGGHSFAYRLENNNP